MSAVGAHNESPTRRACSLPILEAAAAFRCFVSDQRGAVRPSDGYAPAETTKHGLTQPSCEAEEVPLAKRPEPALPSIRQGVGWNTTSTPSSMLLTVSVSLLLILHAVHAQSADTRFYGTVESSHQAQEHPDEEDEHDEHLDDDATIAAHDLVVPGEKRKEKREVIEHKRKAVKT